jgi:hypothetical protein
MRSRTVFTLLLTLAIALSACATDSTQRAQAQAPRSSLEFVDYQGFDSELAKSLAAPLPVVDVAFYDRITPSALPPRLQQWMAAVEAGGGTVKVVPPAGGFSAKSPLMLLGAVSSLWSVSKTVEEVATRAQFRAARAYNAEIVLKADEQGGLIVDKIVFRQRGA